MKIIGFIRCIFHSVILFFQTIKYKISSFLRFIVQNTANTLGRVQEHGFLVFLLFFMVGYAGTIYFFTEGKGNLFQNCIYNITKGNVFTRDGIIILAFVAVIALIAKAIVFRFLDWLYHISAGLVCSTERHEERIMDTKAKLNSSKNQYNYGSERKAREYEMEKFKQSSNYYLNQQKGMLRQ